jgi:1,4-alpha-glucan branching enzyme
LKKFLKTLSTIDWRYLPVGYFGVDVRFGKRRDMQRLIDTSHQRGIAVILDSVYGHSSDIFTYSYIYKKLNFNENPFMDLFSKNYFGESTDYKSCFMYSIALSFFPSLAHAHAAL